LVVTSTTYVALRISAGDGPPVKEDWEYGIYMDSGDVITGIYMENVSGYALQVITDGRIAVGTVDVGLPLASSEHGLEVHCEPAAMTAYTSSFGIRSRYHISVAQTNIVTMHAVDARLRVKEDLAGGVHSGVTGYIEASSSPAFAGGLNAAGIFTLELGSGTTITGDTYMCGVSIDSASHTDLNVASTTYVGLRIWAGDGPPVKEDWEYGILMDDGDVGIGMQISGATTGINLLGTTTNAITIGDATTPIASTAGQGMVEIFSDFAVSASSGGSAEGLYVHQYVSPTVDVTASAFVFAAHFRLEVQGGDSTSCTSQTAAVRTYFMTDGVSSVTFDGSNSTIYAECRIGNNTTFAATGYLAALAINSRTHNSAVFTGEKQYWGIIMGRTSASYQKFYAAMRLTDCTYFLDIKDDDVMADDDDTGVGGTKSGYIRIRFREQGVDRYIRLYTTGS